MDNLGSIYGKPLIRGIETAPTRALKLLRTEVLKRIRAKLVQSTFGSSEEGLFQSPLGPHRTC